MDSKKQKDRQREIQDMLILHSDTSCNSGVTRVCVTRGGNWWCHHIFYWKKLTTFFSYRLWKVMTFFSCRLLTTPIFPRRLSSVLLNSATKINFNRVSPPWRVSSGAVRPPPPPHSDATVLWHKLLFVKEQFIFCILFIILPNRFRSW